MKLSRAAPADAARVTRAEVNLAHVRHNLHELQAVLRDQAGDGTPPKIWAVLKADGYGHGARAMGMTLERAGVDGICVALLEEGIELRNAGVRCPILVMGGYYGRFRDGIEALIAHDLTPVVYDADQVRALAGTLSYLDETKRLAVHVKIDTGMGRLGVFNGDLRQLLDALRQAGQLELEGLMTHLACADAESLDVTREQLERFEETERIVRAAGFRPSLRHAANSAALLRWPGSHLEVVRPGIAVYGVHPCIGRSSFALRIPKLKPVMRVSSEVIALRTLPAGAGVGYGHRWIAPRTSRIATIPMGYADGLPRALSGKGDVLICGKRAPIVGDVSMDLTTVDVTDHPGVSVRDEVVVVGEQKGRLGSETITIEEMASNTDTIPYEVLTSISRRVPRFYRQA
ncbi:MAG: alanine racemase [Deltaproteobacteria bacterium]|nr:alanine racemase [Deltaproteobacteria bacterium]MBW2530766.1 alanine racemase [Deltaproteobacteria bacterium]